VFIIFKTMAANTPTKRLGKNGSFVSALGFGIMGLSAFYGEVADDETRFKVLDRAYELGQTFWDTSDYYGDNEELIGKWFARTGKRDEIFLATKFGFGSDYNAGVRSDAEFVKEACDRSLKRLGVETIDLYYAHRLDGKTPVEDTIEAMVELKKYLSLPPITNNVKLTYTGLGRLSTWVSPRYRTSRSAEPVAYTIFLLSKWNTAHLPSISRTQKQVAFRLAANSVSPSSATVPRVAVS